MRQVHQRAGRARDRNAQASGTVGLKECGAMSDEAAMTTVAESSDIGSWALAVPYCWLARVAKSASVLTYPLIEAVA
jgi:hypothetical protein